MTARMLNYACGLMKPAARMVSELLADAHPHDELDGPVIVHRATQSPCTGRDAALVIDSSYSMDEEDWKPSRMHAAKRAGMAFVTRLAKEEPSARVAIIEFSSRARILCNLVPVSDLAVMDAIRSIRTSSATNVPAGVKAAVQVLAGSGNAQAIILSDGHSNEGGSARPHGVHLRSIATVSTIGIGGSPSEVDEALLRELASEYPDGRKRYRWIGDEDQLVEHFQRLAGRLSRD